LLRDPPAKRLKERAVTVGVLALLEAKPEKAAELAALLEQARELAVAEQQTVSWYAFKADEVTYGIFDTFETDAGRQAHLACEIAQALVKAAPELSASVRDARLRRDARGRLVGRGGEHGHRRLVARVRPGAGRIV
jgi:quinol monooxygenase YgiN